ncbi:uncharacterized protein LOC135204337 [Macrobrachium nipponense]|uniref:uncharacterized protein LOC135204337 n=1 Tax=Macrobrachium nipponense TaxID=159736 RepID=UPI0030C83C3B
MYIDSTKSPREGAVPTSETGVPPSANQVPRTFPEQKPLLPPSHATTNNNGITPSRSFVNRKKLICRCPRGILCGKDIQNARGSHRSSSSSNNGSSSSGATIPMQLNIPLQMDAMMTAYPHLVPDPTKVSGAVPSWASQGNNANANTLSYFPVTTKRELVVRGVHNPLLPYDPNRLIQQQQQLQMQQSKRTLQIPSSYRKRAIDYMMTHLQLRGGENEKGLEAVRKRIERLEEQAFTSAEDKDQYVQLLAFKLGAIMESLYSCRSNRMNLSRTHSTATQPQPTCG